MPKARKSSIKAHNVTTRLEKKDLEQLLIIAEEERRNVAQLVRFAILEYLERRKVAA